MAKIYYDSDADLGYLRGKKVAVIGYGSQGHAHAQNLRDSGIDVIVANRPGSANYRLARPTASNPVSAAGGRGGRGHDRHAGARSRAAEGVPGDRRPNCTEGKPWSSPMASTSTPARSCRPTGIDVLMVAPKGPGHLVRRMYRRGRRRAGLDRRPPGRDRPRDKNWRLRTPRGSAAPGQASSRPPSRRRRRPTSSASRWSSAAACARSIKAGFETLVEAGYQPEAAYFECLHELKLIVDLIYEGGISYMRYSISDTAECGDLTRRQADHHRGDPQGDEAGAGRHPVGQVCPGVDPGKPGQSSPLLGVERKRRRTT